MRRLYLITIGVVASSIFVALPVQAAADDSTTRFQKANSEFADGNFKDAIANYEAIVKSGEWSANLFYNLGNAYYRDQDFGRAILNYERALRLDPHHPEAGANLRLTRDETHALELPPSLEEKYLGPVDPSILAVAAAALFWVAIILLVIRARGGALAGAIVCLILCSACSFALYSIESGVAGKTGAVTVGGNTEARIATADSAKSVLALPPGSEVLILQPRGDWNYVALPNDQRGWIPAKAAEQIQL
ncbi:MAG TPA: tetratricopeptide repeat protein [Chthoniobacterales bacterium]|jgi:tetratricopeptide (TPR) repeat protein